MSDLNDQLKGIFDSAEFQPKDKVWAGVESVDKKEEETVESSGCGRLMLLP